MNFVTMMDIQRCKCSKRKLSIIDNERLKIHRENKVVSAFNENVVTEAWYCGCFECVHDNIVIFYYDNQLITVVKNHSYAIQCTSKNYT